MFYDHEYRERKPQGPLNTAWPEMSTRGSDQDRVREYLEGRQLSYKLAEENGWYPSRDAGDSYLRVVMPAVCKTAEHKYWQARDITGKAHIRYQSPKGPRADALIIVSAKRDDKPAKYVVVVEGPMDALAAAYLGYDAIACMGIDPPPSTIEHLSRHILHRPTVVVFDSEPEATMRATILTMQLSARGTHANYATLEMVNDLAKCNVIDRSIFLKQAFNRLVLPD